VAKHAKNGELNVGERYIFTPKGASKKGYYLFKHPWPKPESEEQKKKIYSRDGISCYQFSEQKFELLGLYGFPGGDNEWWKIRLLSSNKIYWMPRSRVDFSHLEMRYALVSTCVVSQKDYETAKSFIGKTVWKKNYGTDTFFRWGDASKAELNDLENLVELKILEVSLVERTDDWSFSFQFQSITKQGRRVPFRVVDKFMREDPLNRGHLGMERHFYFEAPKQLHPGWPDKIWAPIKQRKVSIGMTQEQAKMSLGEPLKVNKTITSKNARTQWVYDDQYLYFKKGILDSMQTSR